MAANERLDLLLAGETAPPFVFDWERIENGGTLPALQADAFCESLQTPRLDDALTAVVALAVGAISKRLGKKPLADEMKTALGVGVTFVLGTCPVWKPALLPPGEPDPTPTPAWYPIGYSPVIGDPNVAWQWVDKAEFTCTAIANYCWKIRVISRYGCPQSLVVVTSVRDASGIVLEYQQDSTGPIGEGQTAETGFGTLLTNFDNPQAVYVTCT